MGATFQVRSDIGVSDPNLKLRDPKGLNLIGKDRKRKNGQTDTYPVMKAFLSSKFVSKLAW